MIDGLLNLIRREIDNALVQHFTTRPMSITSYNPKTHAVKGIVQPSGVETDWIPIGASHIGNGYGIAVGPTPGSASAMDGDQFMVQFSDGDPNGGVATQRLFSNNDTPPVVQSGEVLISHKAGMSVFLDQNKNLTVTGPTGKNSSIKLDSDGNGTLACGGATALVDKDGKITLTDASGGVVYLAGGKVYLGSKSASNAVETTAGPSSTVFAVI